MNIFNPHPDKCTPFVIPNEELCNTDIHRYVWTFYGKPHVICPFCEITTDSKNYTLQIRPPTLDEYLQMYDMYGNIKG